jgi:DNA-binding beta-propeller fold protein YncE
MCVAAATGVALSTVGLAGASASGAAPPARQAVRVAPAGTSLAAASPGGQLWAKRYNGTGNNADVATSVAVSPTGGTVYVTGQSYGTAGVVDYATVAYNAATGARQWVARYNGPSGSLSNVPSSVAVSPDGKKVFVTGKSIVGQFGDYATIAYNAAIGAQQWVDRYNGTGKGTDIATSLTVNPASGTVYVTGQSFAPSGLYDYATVAYTAAGTQQWVKRPVGSVQYPGSVAVSPTTGTVFVTGANAGDYTTIAYQG